MKTELRRLALPALVAGALACAGALGDTVNIYSERQQVFLEPILTEFEEATGHRAEVLYLDKGAVPRLRAEGSASPADVVIVADIGRLQQLVEEGLEQPIDPAAAGGVPDHLRDPGYRWLALTKRIRALFVARDDRSAPGTFEELADPGWRGRVCLRSGTHPYNVALFAAMLEHHGEEATAAWLEGLRDNLARAPQGNDRAQIKGVADGSCGVAVANLYYYFKMLASDDPGEREAASRVRWVGATVASAGVHINVSGIVLARGAPHREAALELIEFMLGERAQGIYAQANGELPVVEGVAMAGDLAAAAALKADDLPLAAIAAQRRRASELVESVGFNF